MLPAWAGKKIRGPTVNRAPCPGEVFTLCAIMSTDRAGGAAAAGAVRACLSWAWAAVPGLRADLRRLFRAYTLSPLVTLSLHAAFRQSVYLRLSFPVSVYRSVIPCQSMRSGRGVSDFALLSFALSPFSSVYALFSSAFWLISSVILCLCLSDSPF